MASSIEDTILYRQKLLQPGLTRSEFEKIRRDYIFAGEEAREAAYDDKTGANIADIVRRGEKPKGNITVGIGFNMGNNQTVEGRTRKAAARREWDKAFADAATRPSFDKVFSGEARLSSTQIETLYQYAITTRENEIRAEYKSAWNALKANEKLAIQDAFYNGGYRIVGRSTKFYRAIMDYTKNAQTENDRKDHLVDALFELKFRSNINNVPGLKRRRASEAEMLNTYGIDLSASSIGIKYDPTGFLKEIARLKEERARAFVDAVIETHREGFVEQMRRLGRQGPFATPDLNSLGVRFMQDFDRTLSSLGDRLLEMIERALRKAKETGATPEDVRKDLRGEMRRGLLAAGATLRRHFAPQLSG